MSFFQQWQTDQNTCEFANNTLWSGRNTKAPDIHGLSQQVKIAKKGHNCVYVDFSPDRDRVNDDDTIGTNLLPIPLISSSGESGIYILCTSLYYGKTLHQEVNHNFCSILYTVEVFCLVDFFLLLPTCTLNTNTAFVVYCTVHVTNCFCIVLSDLMLPVWKFWNILSDNLSYLFHGLIKIQQPLPQPNPQHLTNLLYWRK